MSTARIPPWNLSLVDDLQQKFENLPRKYGTGTIAQVKLRAYEHMTLLQQMASLESMLPKYATGSKNELRVLHDQQGTRFAMPWVKLYGA